MLVWWSFEPAFADQRQDQPVVDAITKLNQIKFIAEATEPSPPGDILQNPGSPDALKDALGNASKSLSDAITAGYLILLKATTASLSVNQFLDSVKNILKESKCSVDGAKKLTTLAYLHSSIPKVSSMLLFPC